MNYYIITIIIQLLTIVYLLFFKKNNENYINLRDDHKQQYNKCCEGNCYDKPPHLRGSECPKISEKARENLKEYYKQMYTNEEYNKIVRDIYTKKELPDITNIDERIKLLISNETKEKLYRERVKPMNDSSVEKYEKVNYKDIIINNN